MLARDPQGQPKRKVKAKAPQPGRASGPRDAGVQTAIAGTNAPRPTKQVRQAQAVRRKADANPPSTVGRAIASGAAPKVKRSPKNRSEPASKSPAPAKQMFGTSTPGGGKAKKEGGLLASIPSPASALAAVLSPATAAGARVAAPGVVGDLVRLSSKITKNAAREAVDIPLNTPASLYMLGKTAASDPVKAGKMLAQPYIDTFRSPKAFEKAITERPLSTLLLGYGPKGAAGRSAGAVMRKIPATRKLASMERAPATVPGIDLLQTRKYSPDVTTKAVQVVREKRAVKKATKKGGRPPTTMSDPQIRRRVDEHVAASEDIRRVERAAIVSKAQAAITDTKPGRRGKPQSKPSAATTLAVQGVSRSVPELEALLAKYEAAARNLKGPPLRANKTAQAELRTAIKAKAVPTKAADRYTQEVSLPLQKKLVKAGMVDGEQAARARLIPYAVTNMGAKHLSPKDVAVRVEKASAAHSAAVDTLRKAVRDVNQAKAGVAAAQGRAAVLSRNVGGTTAAERAAERVRSPEFQAGGRGYEQAVAKLSDAQAKVVAARAEVRAAGTLLGEAKRLKARGGELVAADGRRLRDQDIRAHMAARGVPEPGYVTNAPNQRGRSNFFVDPSGPAPKITSGKRTGGAIEKGTADLHPDVLIEGAARAQGLVTAAERYGAFVKQFAVRDEAGKVKQIATYKQAVEEAAKSKIGKDGELIPGAVAMRPVRINPFAGRKEQLQATLDTANADVRSVVGAQDAVVEGLSGNGGAGGSWALVPEAAADQMVKHVRVMGTGVPGKAAGIVGSQFRTTVLATNPRWLVGNVVEAAARSLTAGAGPGSYALGRGALKRLDKLDPAAAMEARARTVGGGHMSMPRRVQTFTKADQFAGTKLASTATALGKFWRTPGPKQLASVWNGYTDFVFNTLNGRIESQFQTAMLGKALKSTPLMSERMVKVSRKAMDEAAEGLRNTNAQVAFGREVDRMYGKYAKFTPTQRHLIAGYTPFIAWAINATNFIYRTLPADHPVVTSVMASANQASEDWRKTQGLKVGEKNAAPFFLQGTVPVGSGKLPVGRYLPTGVAASPSGPLGTLAGSLLPQFSSALANLKGKDWKGKDLKPGQSPVLTAAVSLIEGTVPLAGQARRIATNPGTTSQKFRKALDPTYAISSKKPAGSSGGGALPAGMSQREVDALVREATSQSGVPQVSQAEIDALLREQGGK